MTRFAARTSKARSCAVPSQATQRAACWTAPGDRPPGHGRAGLMLLWPGLGAPATAASMVWSAAVLAGELSREGAESR
ncbi:MAG TPA: hypothetical protein VKV33_05760 [Streptosporangiaceae bacterium]|nr:hypothetical protein [Streptosporangiaceae bacterium]